MLLSVLATVPPIGTRSSYDTHTHTCSSTLAVDRTTVPTRCCSLYSRKWPRFAPPTRLIMSPAPFSPREIFSRPFYHTPPSLWHAALLEVVPRQVAQQISRSVSMLCAVPNRPSKPTPTNEKLSLSQRFGAREFLGGTHTQRYMTGQHHLHAVRI